MFQPTLPTANVTMLADSASGARASSNIKHVLGVCGIMDSSLDLQFFFSPITDLGAYLAIGGKNDQPFIDPSDADVNVVRKPKHGHIELFGDWSGAGYMPNDNYVGNDSFVLQIKVGGDQLEIHYFVTVDYHRTPTDDYDKACKGAYWKIANSNDGTPYRIPPLDYSGISRSMFNTANQHGSLGKLGGLAVGQNNTEATTTTLDTSADGYGWARSSPSASTTSCCTSPRLEPLAAWNSPTTSAR